MMCRRCLSGEHIHDRYPSTGEDAGCPFAVTSPYPKGDGSVTECTCMVKMPAPAACVTCGHIPGTAS